MGKDICRSILIYSGIKIPDDVDLPFEMWKDNADGDDLTNIRNLILSELRNNKELIEEGNGDSSWGSDDAPSDDNLELEEIVQLVPAVDKKLKNALKKFTKKQSDLK